MARSPTTPECAPPPPPPQPEIEQFSRTRTAYTEITWPLLLHTTLGQQWETAKDERGGERECGGVTAVSVKDECVRRH